MFDGTYFHKDGCLVLLMDAWRSRLLDYWYIARESYEDIYPRLLELKNKGLNPMVTTLDGHKTVIAAFENVWPGIVIQRCLFHIEHQGLMWIRHYPKSLAGQRLRIILKNITGLRSAEDKQRFISLYRSWQKHFGEFIRKLPKDSMANKDLKRTTALIDHALPNMFQFIKDQKIASTTNLLENFYSQLKHQYRNHRGLAREHKISFLNWYCHFKTMKKSNIL